MINSSRHYINNKILACVVTRMREFNTNVHISLVFIILKRESTRNVSVIVTCLKYIYI